MLLGLAIRAMATPARLRGPWQRLGHAFGFPGEQLVAAQASPHTGKTKDDFAGQS
jgi:hypothetical protein